MWQVKAPLITRYDYQEMAQGPPYFQVIEGELIMSPSPNTYHQTISRNLCLIIGRFLEKKQVGEVYLAPLDVFLSETNVYQPDVIFIGKGNLARITDRGIEGAPDLVVEILSSGTARFDRGSKRKIYAQTGVTELWIVDPDVKSIQVYRLAQDPETPVATHSATSVFSSQVLPGLKVKAAAVFKSSLRQ
jgi:Uma2 family endonuclease